MDPMSGSEPASTLNWTGERLVPGASGDAIAEHLHRYALAREFAKGRTVLDIASGEGYGTALLAEVAREVVGVEIDAAAVAHASAKYARPNLRYVQGSATAIPLETGVVDLAVSFETIEHLAEHEQMLAELRRVLRPGGLLVISSPERREYTEAAHYRNPHHVKELDADEFAALLKRHFPHVEMLGQRLIYGSAIAGSNGAGGLRVFAGDFEKIEATDGVPRPRFLVARCSDVPIAAAPASIFEDAVEREALEKVEAVYRVGRAEGWLSRLRAAIAGERKLSLKPQLACKIRSFTVTLAGRVPAGAEAVRARLREKFFEGRIVGEEFEIEVNVGSGRHPCTIEARGADGAWHPAGQVRVEAPEVTFKAHERGV
jgi:SAM-dependent methyltransferase